ncbi:MAG: 50S ribosomal protein L30 [Gemmatimonadales bacterium]
MPSKAKTPGGDGSGKLRVKQVRSGIGHPKGHRATLRSIGLKHHQDVVIVPDTPSVRGMLNKVRHLVEVTPVAEA